MIFYEKKLPYTLNVIVYQDPFLILVSHACLIIIAVLAPVSETLQVLNVKSKKLFQNISLHT